MVNYVIALEPEWVLFNKITKLKEKVKKIVGKQLYLGDEPHLTIFVGDFESCEKWLEGLKKLIKNKISGLTIEINRWDIFGNDVITQMKTLACGIEQKDYEKLRALQMMIVNYLLNHKTNVIIPRYSKIIDNIDETLKENIKKFGFPFIGDIWKPHFGIASFDEGEFKRVWNNIKDSCPIGKFSIKSVNIYELEKTEKLKIINKIRLKNVNNNTQN